VSTYTREVTTDKGATVSCRAALGKRRYAVGGGGEIIGGGSYRISSSYPIRDASGRPDGWAVNVAGIPRYTIVVPGSQTTSKTTGGAFAGGHTHQFDPGPRLMPLEGFGKPAVVRVFAICARLN
jgi:hypothetical protein